MIICVADWSKFPGGRNAKDCDYSGEEFRKDFLMPALKKLGDGEKLTVDLSKVYTYAPTWLDEVFAEPIRRNLYSYEEMIDKLEFKADLPNEFFISMIKGFMQEAKESIQADEEDDMFTEIEICVERMNGIQLMRLRKKYQAVLDQIDGRLKDMN